MAPAKKSAAKKATAKKATAKKATAKKATKRTAKKATAKKTAASSGGNVVVASKVREAVRSQDIRMSSEFVEALNDEVNDLIVKAVDRAKGNSRGTVRPGDL
jgi:hypothetical protein